MIEQVKSGHDTINNTIELYETQEAYWNIMIYKHLTNRPILITTDHVNIGNTSSCTTHALTVLAELSL